MEMLNEYVVGLVLSTCLAIGYLIKHSMSFIPNAYIPAILAVIGVGMNAWINMAFTPEILIGGLASGLAAVGAYEFGRNTINKVKENK